MTNLNDLSPMQLLDRFVDEEDEEKAAEIFQVLINKGIAPSQELIKEKLVEKFLKDSMKDT